MSEATAATTGATPDPESVASTDARSVEPTMPLFERFPRLASRIPRAALGQFPTPIEAAPRLGEALGLAPLEATSLFVKRDDVSGERYGGGKTRKLELFLGDAIRLAERDATPRERRLVTFGGVGSNQAVATAIYGEHLGFTVELWLAAQPESDLVRENLTRLTQTRAFVRRCDGVADAEARAERRARHDPSLYVIPAGGTTPLGTLAFVSAGLELAQDFRSGRAPTPARIYAALGSGGSAVGLAIGLAIAQVDTTVVAVRASSPETSSAARLLAHARETVAYARALDPSFPAIDAPLERLRIDGRFLGRGYGAPTEAGEKARASAAAAGLPLESVYTGKTLASLAKDARDGVRGPWLFLDSQSSRGAPTL